VELIEYGAYNVIMNNVDAIVHFTHNANQMLGDSIERE
jgi:hypothetical protein